MQEIAYISHMFSCSFVFEQNVRMCVVTQSLFDRCCLTHDIKSIEDNLIHILFTIFLGFHLSWVMLVNRQRLSTCFRMLTSRQLDNWRDFQSCRLTNTGDCQNFVAFFREFLRTAQGERFRKDWRLLSGGYLVLWPPCTLAFLMT